MTIDAKQSFQDRLARISNQAPTEAAERVEPTQRVGANEKMTDGQPRRIPKSAFVAGGLAMAALMLANVMVFDGEMNPPNPGDFFGKMVLALGPFGLTAGFLFVMMIGFGMRDKPHIIGIAIALPALYFSEPYLANMMPDLWASFYSHDHVNNMLIQAGLRAPPLVQ